MPTYVKTVCNKCNVEFDISLKLFNLNKKRNCKNYCSIECSNKSHNLQVEVNCKQCNKLFNKRQCDIKKTKNNFCSYSCAAIYRNSHKESGFRRSKLEVYLEETLSKNFPKLEIKYNDRKTINCELDIYIPSLSLAFELNGIFHYEPIFGEEKLKTIQNNDCRKFQACLENGIELCILDTSSMKYFKNDKAKKYVDIIENIIRQKSIAG